MKNVFGRKEFKASSQLRAKYQKKKTTLGAILSHLNPNFHFYPYQKPNHLLQSNLFVTPNFKIGEIPVRFHPYLSL